jgi:hypothetical protein
MIDDATRENEVLEYKTASKPFSDRERMEIAKDISGLANSLGGVIIYGISTSKSDPTLPDSIQPLHIKNIETLDRVINSQIRPPISGIRKRIIPSEQPKVLVVDVPPSEDPPHQNLYDKKYYHRSGSECIPMDHDLVALKFGRKLSPVLDLGFQALSTPNISSEDPTWCTEARLRILLKNQGRRVGKNISMLLFFPPIECVRLVDVGRSMSNIDSLYGGAQVRQFTDNQGVFHPGLSTSIIEIGCSFAKTYTRVLNTDFISWTLYAEEMNPRQGAVSFSYLGWQS